MFVAVMGHESMGNTGFHDGDNEIPHTRTTIPRVDFGCSGMGYETTIILGRTLRLGVITMTNNCNYWAYKNSHSLKKSMRVCAFNNYLREMLG